MKQGRNLQELADEVTRQANAKRDYVVRPSAVAMADDARLALPRLEPLPVQETAHRQLAEYLDIPQAYYSRMLSGFPSLLATNVNALVKARPAGEQRLLRTLDNNCRAWLSNHYRPIDNVDLMEQLLPVLFERSDLTFASSEVTEKRLYLKVISTELEGEVKPGDVVRMGLLISNSEVGLGSVVIAPFSERLVCRNGATHMNFGQRKSHVGRALGGDDNEDASQFFSDETRKADDRAFYMKVRDVVKATLAGDVLGRLLQDMREAAEDKLEGNPSEVVEAVTMRLGLTEKERGSALRNLIEGADLSRWGLANAITRTAQEVDSYDRATELESIGGQMMTVPIAPEMTAPIKVKVRRREAARTN